MCRTTEQVAELVYGTAEHQLTHYFDTMSVGKTFAMSPLKDKQGLVRPAIEIDRGKDYENGGNCFQGAEKKGILPSPYCTNEVGDGPSIHQQMAEIFDFDRYRITHENGPPNVLAPYRPSREYAAADWARDIYRGDSFVHRNVTPIYNYGTFQSFLLGKANQPKKGHDAEVTVSNEEHIGTWVHELGHALFGLPDLYYNSNVGAVTYNVGPVDIMGDRSDSWVPLTAWSLITSELAEPEPLISDLEMSNFIYLDGYQLPAQEWTSTPAPAIPAIPAVPGVAYTLEPAFVEVQKDGLVTEEDEVGYFVDGLAGVASVTVSPDNSHVYAAGYSNNAIAVFSRDSSTGALTFVEMHKDGVDGVNGLERAISVTVSPDGSHVYAAGVVDDAIAVFTRNSSTGALTYVGMYEDGVGGVDGLDGAFSVTVSPDGSHVYAAGVVDDAVTVFSRDSSTGALTYIEMYKDGVGGVDGLDGVRSVSVSPDNSHVYAAGFGDDAIAVFTRNSSTGALTFVEMYKDGVGGVDGLDGVRSVSVSPDNSHVYAAGFGDDAIAVFTRNSSTGALTFVEMHKDGVGGVDGLIGVSSVTVSPDGSHVYAAGVGDDAIAVFTRN